MVAQVIDANERFTYAVDEDAMCVVGGPDGITAEEDIFVLDHAITVKWVPATFDGLMVWIFTRCGAYVGMRTSGSCCERCQAL